MKPTALFFVICILTAQIASSQSTFVGKLNLNKKDKKFTLISAKDSLTVTIEKKDIGFDAANDFQLIKIKNKQYNLVLKGDTIKLTESKSKIEFSTGLVFYITSRKPHQIILANTNKNIVVDAKYNLKGNTANFEIKISDKNYESKLLAYATKYLYESCLNEVNLVPFYYFMY